MGGLFLLLIAVDISLWNLSAIFCRENRERANELANKLSIIPNTMAFLTKSYSFTRTDEDPAVICIVARTSQIMV